MDGYYQFNLGASCVKCSDNCVDCANGLVCDTCDTGFFPKTLNEKIICSPCVSNCDDCDNAYVCKACATGYFKDDSQLCVACSANCD